MNNYRLLFVFLFSAGLGFFSSCSDDGGEADLITGVLISHEGNFGSGNGSISLYNEETMTVINDAVAEANNDSEVGATIQSVYPYDGVGYIVCNNSDKIEFISLDNYTYLDNPLSELSQPRYMVASGGKGYVTCWGPWNYDDYSLPNSYVAVIDLASREVNDSLECGSGAEGIIIANNKLFVANSYESSISVFDLGNNSNTTVDLETYGPVHFVRDNANTLWFSTSTGLQSINPSTLELGDAITITNMNGKIAIDGNAETIYLLTSQAWPNTGTEIYTFDTETQTLGASALFSGDNFYGIGVNPTTNKIYVSNSNNFAGPGTISVYNADGTLLDQEVVGIGPSGFLFN